MNNFTVAIKWNFIFFYIYQDFIISRGYRHVADEGIDSYR